MSPVSNWHPRAFKLPALLAPWELHFRAAGAECGLSPLLLAAVCEVESGGGAKLFPQGPYGSKDSGQKWGLMGLDARIHGRHIVSCDWRDALTNIHMGAEVLADLQHRAATARFPPAAALAAYNVGFAVVRQAMAHEGDSDLYTTDSYATRVLRLYRKLLAAQAS
jgi:hypothetical protein